MLGIAWKWQAAVHGGLPKPLERRLAALEAAFRSGACRRCRDGPHRHRRGSMPGARLIRVWKGERHEVQVTRDRLSLARPRLDTRSRPSPARSPAAAATARPSSACATGMRHDAAHGPGRKPIRCAIYTRKSHRGGARAGLQLARCPARGLRRLRPQPEARGLDRPAPTATTMAAISGGSMERPALLPAARRRRGRQGRRGDRLQGRPADPLAHRLRPHRRDLRRRRGLLRLDHPGLQHHAPRWAG